MDYNLLDNGNADPGWYLQYTKNIFPDMTLLEIYRRQLGLAEILLENSKDEEMKKNAQELYDLCKKEVGQ